MPRLTDVGYIRELLSGCGFTFSKSKGQNFLIDPSVCPRMAEKCGCDNIGVLEIGAGVGVLTSELARRAARVVYVELDKRLKPVLDVTLDGYDNITPVFGDILEIDLDKLIKENFGGMEVVVCANLPYYITSPVVMRLLESRLPLSSVTVMVQREAADRLCAAPGTRSSGAITAAVNYYATVQKLFSVPRGCFMPSPNVDSTVIQFKLHKTPPVVPKSEKMMFKVIKAAYEQRRKTLPNALSSGLSATKDSIIAALKECEIKLTARAEELSLKQFAALSDALSDVEIGLSAGKDE